LESHYKAAFKRKVLPDAPPGLQILKILKGKGQYSKRTHTEKDFLHDKTHMPPEAI
jgi:hypothetical protein